MFANSYTYHAHAAHRSDPARASARAQRDTALCIEIRRVFEENFRVYGVRKVWRQLGREGITVARCTVTRLMRRMGLRGAVRGRSTRTTVPDRTAPCPLDRVQRQFKPPQPNRLWVSDFTYVAAWLWIPIQFGRVFRLEAGHLAALSRLLGLQLGHLDPRVDRYGGAGCRRRGS